ncbi:MAG: hypothetical protein Q9221_003401 [Calogaya cf. arnoldii]
MTEPRRTPSTPAAPQHSNRSGKTPTSIKKEARMGVKKEAAMGIKTEETPDKPLQKGVSPTHDIHPDPLQEYYVVWRTSQTDLTSASSQFSAELLGMFKDRDTANGYVKESYLEYPQFKPLNDVEINRCAQRKLVSGEGTAVIQLKVTAVYCSPTNTDLSWETMMLPLPEFSKTV